MKVRHSWKKLRVVCMYGISERDLEGDSDVEKKQLKMVLFEVIVLISVMICDWYCWLINPRVDSSKSLLTTDSFK